MVLISLKHTKLPSGFVLNRTPQMRISFVDRCAAFLCTCCALFAFTVHDMHFGPATEERSWRLFVHMVIPDIQLLVSGTKAVQRR